MGYSVQTKRFAKHLVIAYKQYCKDDKRYFVDIDRIADFDIDHLVSLMMIDEPEMAREANSADNKLFSDLMINALINYMNDSCCKENMEDFAALWARGVRDYFKSDVEKLLSNELDDLQCE